MTRDLQGALCVGLHDTFDSEDPEQHVVCRKVCAACPVREQCERAYQNANAETLLHGFGPSGTWAGQLHATFRSCGTLRGFRRHIRSDTVPCEPCVKAMLVAPNVRCGTLKGWLRHHAVDESPCLPCQKAFRTAEKNREYKAKMRT